MQIDDLGLLRLLQVADSALPIGATAHSFGLETLVEEGLLSVTQLDAFLRDYLEETGTFESIFCRRAHRLAGPTDSPDTTIFSESWLALNAELSAYKSARESRSASATLGRRLLQLIQNLHPHETFTLALQTAKETGIEIHHSPAFGLVGTLLGVDEYTTTLAYLHQSMMSLVSACQRMLPLGQSQASTLLWQLKPNLLNVAQRSEDLAQQGQIPAIFTPICEIGSMRHPALVTRLFIS